MRFPHGPGGYGMFGGILEDILVGLFFLICFAIAVGLLFLVVRFLLAATRAAEIYVANNGPVRAAEPVAPPAPVTPAPAAPQASAAKAPVATRARSVKTPPTT